MVSIVMLAAIDTKMAPFISIKHLKEDCSQMDMRFKDGKLKHLLVL